MVKRDMWVEHVWECKEGNISTLVLFISPSDYTLYWIRCRPYDGHLHHEWYIQTV